MVERGYRDGLPSAHLPSIPEGSKRAYTDKPGVPPAVHVRWEMSCPRGWPSNLRKARGVGQVRVGHFACRSSAVLRPRLHAQEFEPRAEAPRYLRTDCSESGVKP